jgi:hypothetical protein
MSSYVAVAFAQDGVRDGKISTKTVSAATAQDLRVRFSGTYRYAGSAQEQEARRSAIDRSVAGMSFVIRSTARSRITATTQILDSYSFSFEPQKIVVRPTSRPEMITADDGAPVDYVYKGNTSKLTQQFIGDRISQVFVSEDGRRENEFTLSGDGKTLNLKVTLSSARLSTPVVYMLTYAKVS